MRRGNNFPSTPYEVFSQYVEHCLDRDAERVRSRRGMSTDELRAWAERIAFAMTSDPALGLSPLREDLRSALRHEYQRLSLARLGSALDALEYIKLGRSDGSAEIGNVRQFTFSHRRFQEYFTTRVVIKDPARVSTHQLLTDARWRETAVVLLQTGNATDSQTIAISAEATTLLEEANRRYGQRLTYEGEQGEHLTDVSTPSYTLEGIQWPAGCLHILGILQAGFGSRADVIPEYTRQLSAKVLDFAFQHGNLLDRKFAIEVGGITPQNVLLEFIRGSLTIDSHWLNDVIYHQIARLSEIPDDIITWIRGAILRWALTGQLARNWHGVRTHLMRLPVAHQLIQVARLARCIIGLDLAASMGMVAALSWCALGRLPSSGTEIIELLSVLASIVILIKIYWMVYGSSANALRITLTINSIFFLSAISDINISSYVGALTAVLYFGLWGPAAARCVNLGSFSRIAQWPFIPLIFLVDFSRGIKKIIPYCREHPNQIMLLTKSTLLVVLLTGTWVELAVYVPNLRKWGPLFIGGAYIIFVLIGVSFNLFLIGRDYLILRSFHLNRGSDMDAHALISQYNRLISGIWRLSLLRRVRKQNTLLRNKESERAVRRLLYEVEREYASLQVEREVAKDPISVRYRSILKRSFTGYKRFASGKIFPRLPEQRDELYMLLEGLTRDRSIKSLGGTDDSILLSERAANRIAAPSLSL